jgi:hypothetical protein
VCDDQWKVAQVDATQADGVLTHWLPASHGPYDEQGLGPYRDGIGQRGIRRGVGQILLTGEESYERSAPLRDVVTERAAQHRIAGFEGIKDGALRHWTLDV